MDEIHDEREDRLYGHGEHAEGLERFAPNHLHQLRETMSRIPDGFQLESKIYDHEDEPNEYILDEDVTVEPTERPHHFLMSIKEHKKGLVTITVTTAAIIASGVAIRLRQKKH